MTRIKRTAAVLFAAVLASSSGLLFPAKAAAVGGHAATNLIGHYDAFGNPDYNKTAVNNGGSPGPIGFNVPGATAIDPVRHLLFVGEYSNRRVTVHQLDSSNRPIDGVAEYVLGKPNFTDITSTGPSGSLLRRGIGLAYDGATQSLFVADSSNHRVLMFDTSTLVNGESAVHVLGHSTFTADNPGLAIDRMNYPTGVWVDKDSRRLFVSDVANKRVLIFDIAVVVDGEPAINVLGQADFDSKVEAASSVNLILPWQLNYDNVRKRLFVGDQHRVAVFDLNVVTNGEPIAYAIGQPNIHNNIASTSSSGLSNAYGIGLDVAGQRLWVADRDNYRVMEFNIAFLATGMEATDVFGKADFVSAGASAVSSTSLGQPEAVTFDPTAGLVVTDSGNGRILFFDDNRAGRAQVAVTVDPWLTFGVNGLAANASCNGVTPSSGTTSSGTGVNLGAPNAGTNKIAGQTLAVGTNAGGGYTVVIKSAGPLSAGLNTIADLGATNAGPIAFPVSGTPAFGYTVDDLTLGTGTAGRFQNASDVANPSRWSGLGAPGELIFEPANLAGSTTYCVAYQVGVSPQTPSGSYSTTVTYTAVPIF